EATDFQLLRDYAEKASDEAFRTLVDRHVNLVYSVALSRLGDGAAAKDVSQIVFAALARKAAQLSEKVVLSGWLFQVTAHACQDWKRAEARRKKRESEAMQQQLVDFPSADRAGHELKPVLSEVLASLATTE